MCRGTSWTQAQRAKGGRNAAAAKKNKGMAAALEVFQESADDAERYAGLTAEERADRMVQILWLMADSAGVSIRNRDRCY